MIIHKCVQRDINKCLVKERGQEWQREGECCVKVREISSRLLRSLKANTHSESLSRNRVCDVFRLFKPINSFTKHFKALRVLRNA